VGGVDVRVRSMDYDGDALYIAFTYTGEEGRVKPAVLVSRVPSLTAALMLGKRSEYFKQYHAGGDDTVFVDELLDTYRKSVDVVERGLRDIYVAPLTGATREVAGLRIDELAYGLYPDALPAVILYTPLFIEYPVFAAGYEIVRGYPYFVTPSMIMYGQKEIGLLVVPIHEIDREHPNARVIGLLNSAKKYYRTVFSTSQGASSHGVGGRRLAHS